MGVCWVKLSLVQVRPQVLYARRWLARAMPACLALGFAVWLVGLWTWKTRQEMWPWAISGVGGLALVVLSPLLSLSAVLLLVDRRRGWVHWRKRRWPSTNQESFSPERMEGIEVARHGGLWRVCLKMDHPRLDEIVLSLGVRRGRAYDFARHLASMLGLNWYDEKGLMHVPIEREAERWATPWLEHFPPPPEVSVLKRRAGRLVFRLSNIPSLYAGPSVFLIYSIIWCLWAWSSLVMILATHSDPLTWQTGPCAWIIPMLIGGSLAGAVMLVAAMGWALGVEELTWTHRGLWIMRRRWLGVCWGWRRFRTPTRQAVRRVDPPSEEAGLWIGRTGNEVQMGAGLSSDALAWLQQLLLAGVPTGQQGGPNSERL